MAFYESPRFPERIAYGAQGGPEWATTVVVTVSGREQRNAAWQYPRHRWDVSQGINDQADFDTLRAHFLTVQGRLHGWRFKDWSDYTVSLSQGRVQEITTTTFQLVKRYTSGAQTLDRQIRKPLASPFELRNSGTPLTPTTDYTLDTTTGIVTTTSPRTAANLTWSGEFDVPMRYDTDRLDARIVGRNAGGLLHEWSAIPIVEIVV
jgi:uncharacterized protein (TIGR02217 family)